MTFLAKEIRRGMDGREATHIVVFGKEGSGKSAFSMKIAHEILQDWDDVLNAVTFDLRDAVRNLTEAQIRGEVLPLIILDDAGVSLHGARYSISGEDAKLMSMYEGMADTARSAVSGLFYTCPSPRKLTRNLRERPGSISVKITKSAKGRWQRIARIWRIYWSVYKKRTGAMKVAETYFSCKLPDDVYREYIERRKTFDLGLRVRLLRALEEKSDLKDLREYYERLKQRVGAELQ